MIEYRGANETSHPWPISAFVRTLSCMSARNSSKSNCFACTAMVRRAGPACIAGYTSTHVALCRGGCALKCMRSSSLGTFQWPGNPEMRLLQFNRKANVANSHGSSNASRLVTQLATTTQLRGRPHACDHDAPLAPALAGREKAVLSSCRDGMIAGKARADRTDGAADVTAKEVVAIAAMIAKPPVQVLKVSNLLDVEPLQ